MGDGYGCPVWVSTKVMGHDLEKSYPPSQERFLLEAGSEIFFGMFLKAKKWFFFLITEI